MARAGLTRAGLVEAAAVLVDEVGTAGLTVSALARRVRVQPASLYSHVTSTDDLRSRVTQLALAEMADRVADGIAGRAGKDAVRGFADAYRGYAREHPGRYAASRLPLDAQAAASGAGPRHAEMARAVLRGYDLTGEDQTHGVRLLGSLVHGFVDLEASGGFSHSAPPSQRSWERLVDTVDLALRAWVAA
ncbi:TetR/AcrR family transcriptional regulator [Aquipuribacter hungaricus]|uniref:TetR/AcrR family transcriptional regulator n=1 Tax=Aquipuribacter hungaricus TaxID=545624 RepID=A0ABV7WGV6_9MICO